MSATETNGRGGQTRAPAHRFGRELPPKMLGFVMNLPTLLTLTLVLAYPIYYAGYLSLHKVTLIQLRSGNFPFIGFGNYERVLTDPLFLVSLGNTLIFTAFTVVVEVVAAVMIAILINQQDIWTSRVTRFLILLPYAVPPIANGLIWSFMYNGKLGFLNRLLYSVGAIDRPIDWTGDADTALFAVAVPYIWRTLPFAVLLVHAALQGINKELFEAASVDGAGPWRRFCHITLPLIMPVIVVLLVLRTSFAVAVFDEILAITQGGPGDATWVASWYSYRKGFAPPFDIGMGAASAFILALMVAFFALLYIKLLYRRVD